MSMSACAGFVDAASFMRLRMVFSSFMTGNTVHLSYDLNHLTVRDAAHYGWAILCFVMGLVLSSLLEQWERRSGIRSSFAVVLLLESLLLALFIWFSGVASAPLWLLIFLTCFALGMQTVTLTHAGKQRLWTTFQTGNLSKFGENFAKYCFWLRDRTRGRLRRRLPLALRLTPRQEAARNAAASLGVWLGFFSGALAGAAAHAAWGAVSLWFPIAGLSAIAVLDVTCPTALGDHSD